MSFLEIFKTYRKSILFILSLALIENIAWIIEPTIFGDVIDSFIQTGVGNQKEMFAYFSLFLWIGLFLTNSGAGALRRSLDQKIYLRIYNNIIEKIPIERYDSDEAISKIGVRAELSREYIHFFQHRLPDILEQLISIFGALFALTFFDWRLALTCLTVLFPITFFNSVYNKKVIALQKEFHDKKENMYNIFKSRNKNIISKYFIDLAIPQRRIANWSAMNFGFIRLSLLIIFLAVMYISIDLDNFSTGEFYSIIAYIWTFISSSEYVPELMESWTSLSDISNRLKEITPYTID